MSKQYTDEFKTMVVELYKSGKPAGEIMREYGLTSSTFYKWTKAKAELAVDGQVVTTEEVRRLKKQLAQLSLENDIQLALRFERSESGASFVLSQFPDCFS